MEKEKKFLKILENKINFLTFVRYMKNILWKKNEKKEKKFRKNLADWKNFCIFVEYKISSLKFWNR